jgi:hypothetical protein
MQGSFLALSDSHSFVTSAYLTVAATVEPIGGVVLTASWIHRVPAVRSPSAMLKWKLPYPSASVVKYPSA